MFKDQGDPCNSVEDEKFSGLAILSSGKAPPCPQSGRGTRNEKNPQLFSRVQWECPKWELRNEPPLDRSGLTPEIPFMASLWIRSGYDMKVEMSAETYQVGAHFKALIKAILVAPLKSFERFFRISSSPAGLWPKSTRKLRYLHREMYFHLIVSSFGQKFCSRSSNKTTSATSMMVMHKLGKSVPYFTKTQYWSHNTVP